MFKSNKILRTRSGTPRCPDFKSNKILQITRTSSGSWWQLSVGREKFTSTIARTSTGRRRKHKHTWHQVSSKVIKYYSTAEAAGAWDGSSKSNNLWRITAHTGSPDPGEKVIIYYSQAQAAHPAALVGVIIYDHFLFGDPGLFWYIILYKCKPKPRLRVACEI